MAPMMDQNQPMSDYNQDRKLILTSLDKLAGDIESLYDRARKIDIDIAVLKVKVAMWAFLGSAIATALIELGVSMIKGIK